MANIYEILDNQEKCMESHLLAEWFFNVFFVYDLEIKKAIKSNLLLTKKYYIENLNTRAELQRITQILFNKTESKYCDLKKQQMKEKQDQFQEFTEKIYKKFDYSTLNKNQYFLVKPKPQQEKEHSEAFLEKIHTTQSFSTSLTKPLYTHQANEDQSHFTQSHIIQKMNLQLTKSLNFKNFKPKQQPVYKKAMMTSFGEEKSTEFDNGSIGKNNSYFLKSNRIHSALVNNLSNCQDEIKLNKSCQNQQLNMEDSQFGKRQQLSKLHNTTVYNSNPNVEEMEKNCLKQESTSKRKRKNSRIHQNFQLKLLTDERFWSYYKGRDQIKDKRKHDVSQNKDQSQNEQKVFDMDRYFSKYLNNYFSQQSQFRSLENLSLEKQQLNLENNLDKKEFQFAKKIVQNKSISTEKKSIYKNVEKKSIFHLQNEIQNHAKIFETKCEMINYIQNKKNKLNEFEKEKLQKQLFDQQEKEEFREMLKPRLSGKDKLKKIIFKHRNAFQTKLLWSQERKKRKLEYQRLKKIQKNPQSYIQQSLRQDLVNHDEEENEKEDIQVQIYSLKTRELIQEMMRLYERQLFEQEQQLGMIMQHKKVRQNQNFRQNWQLSKSFSQLYNSTYLQYFLNLAQKKNLDLADLVNLKMKMKSKYTEDNKGNQARKSVQINSLETAV